MIDEKYAEPIALFLIGLMIVTVLYMEKKSLLEPK